jgi:hypothetical protein
MRFSSIALTVLLAGATAVTPVTTASPLAAAAGQQKLPPLSYVCQMPGDEDVISDAPGSCPKCRMALVPIRLEAKFSCPVHSTQEVKDGPGKCRFDGRELVPVTLSVFWTCGGDEKHLMDPGACDSGQPRRIGYAVRAHGDHNPRHGGQFFMAQDAWHHVEATIQPGNVFRVFFYDNFTKPIAVKDFQARVVTREEWDPVAKKTNELEKTALAPGQSGQTLEAPLKGLTLPAKLAAVVKFGANSPEQRFDFNFAELSKEPAAPVTSTASAVAPAVPSTRAAAPVSSSVSSPSPSPVATVAPAAKAAAAAAPARASAAAQAAPAAPAAQAPAPTPATAAVQAQPAAGAQTVDPSVEVGGFSAIPAALAAALDESTLPAGMPALVAELSKRSLEVQQMVNDGNLGQVWLPAMGTKTVALALGSHADALPERERAAASLAVKRVVMSAWELDAYGDMGNKQRMSEAYERLAAAVAELKAAYAPSR